jgi:hypothetical protein
MLDIVLGVAHDGVKSRTFLLAMRDYMLRSHREFLKYRDCGGKNLPSRRCGLCKNDAFSTPSGRKMKLFYSAIFHFVSELVEPLAVLSLAYHERS